MHPLLLFRLHSRPNIHQTFYDSITATYPVVILVPIKFTSNMETWDNGVWLNLTAVSIFVNILVGLTYISTNIETAVLSRYMLSIFYRFATEAIDAAVEVGGRLKLGKV